MVSLSHPCETLPVLMKGDTKPSGSSSANRRARGTVAPEEEPPVGDRTREPASEGGHDMRPQLTLVYSDSYRGWTFSEDHPSQGRRFINGYQRVLDQAKALGIRVDVVRPRRNDAVALLPTVHSTEYIDEVLTHSRCSEWEGQRSDLAVLAATFVAGTLTALDELLSGRTQTAVHLPGGKHHAQRDHGSGFCVFNDFAIAALEAVRRGHRVAILDIDAHHGDGIESLLRDNDDVLTFSVHQAGLFPGTGFADEPAKHVYNRPLTPPSDGKSLLHAVHEFTEVANAFNPGVIFVVAGADGHREDPLSDLSFPTYFYRAAAGYLRRNMPQLPMIIGGGGGYKPDDITPEVWAEFACTVASTKSLLKADAYMQPRLRAAPSEAHEPRTESTTVHYGLPNLSSATDDEIQAFAQIVWNDFTNRSQADKGEK